MAAQGYIATLFAVTLVISRSSLYYRKKSWRGPGRSHLRSTKP
jgi:hypothetical protein